MTELWLNFTDASGETRRVSVEGEKFVIGRHSENDLSIADGSLSRRHAQIERFGDVFVISDLDSSNGTTLNDAELDKPAALKKGDKFNLGGGYEFEVELISDHETAGDSAFADSRKDSEEQAEIAAAVSEKDLISASPASPPGGGSMMSFFILAPLLGFVVLLFVGGGLFLLSGDGKEVGGNQGNFIYSVTPQRTPRAANTGDETPTPSVKPSAGASQTPSNTTINSPTPQNSGELDKIERSALLFTRRIAVNDNNYVFARPHLNEINNRLRNFKNSDALRENLKAVKQNASQFEQLAKSKGLKPQFLATAALARIGNQRGNPLQTAQSMLNVLGELKISLGNELADENLLIIAAVEQGERGEFRAMRNTVEVLSKQPGVDSDRARTIWYLREKGKLSDAQYEFVLRFLAIGTISQNPPDFNVETDAVVFE
ncbi:MAG TPA: FHA domain-containing protein [Pyrinomonadaceae bacterium]|nr:FHA domain-containing protein [Pyrinomonadaceae bacterium]